MYPVGVAVGAIGKGTSMLPALALGALSFGGSLLSGIGAGQASAKQARLQIIADNDARHKNQIMLNEVNAKREALGREMLTIPEETGSWVDVDGMMAAAERSGFNPVTFLNAGGMQAYQQTWRTGHNAADAFKLMAPEYALQQASQVPQQHSALSAFGGALSAGASAFGTQFRADQSFDLQMARMGLGMANQGMGMSQSNGLMQTLAYGGGTVAGGGAGGSGGGSLSSLPYPQSWKRGDVDVTNPWYGLSIDPKSSDAESFEARYGDIAQEIAGAYNFVNDMTYNSTGKTAGQNVSDWWNTIPSFIGNPASSMPHSSTPWSFRETPGMRYLFGPSNVYSAPWMRSGNAAP